MTGHSDREAAPLDIASQMPPPEVLFGATEGMQELRRKLERAAQVNVPVLFRGESGTGKEILAKYFHSISGSDLFLKLDCPSLSEARLEKELSEFARKVFSEASTSEPEHREFSPPGSLFFDEVVDLSESLQPIVLQLLQNGTVPSAEFRILSSTNRNPEDALQAGRFRADLYYRLDGVTIHVPPLRERRQDIARLANYFVDLYSRTFHVQVPSLSDFALSKLEQHGWEGNIRELENIIRRYVIFREEALVVADLIDRRQEREILVPEISLKGNFSLKRATQKAVRELERNLIVRVLELNHWNRQSTAATLKISDRLLMYKIRDCAIPWPPAHQLQPEAVPHAKSSNTKCRHG